MSDLSFHNVTIGGVEIGRGRPLALIAGCCAIESEERTFRTCEALARAAAEAETPFVFKASFDKANRNSVDSYRGPGLDEGLRVLGEVRRRFGVPVLTDVHETSQVEAVAAVVDALQIPAFLARQTDLALAAGRSGKPVNVKKGQFMAPWDMANVVGKIGSTGNRQILLTERGASFGYNRLVTDFTALPIMRALGHPVVFDVTHSVQQPAGQGACSGGNREMIGFLARAACAVGVDALFIEVHDDPDNALCDGPNSLPLEAVGELLRVCREIDRLVDEPMRGLPPSAG